MVDKALVTSFVMWLCLAELVALDLEVRMGDGTRSIGGFAIVLTAGVVAFPGATGRHVGAGRGVLFSLHSVVALVVVVGARRARQAFGSRK